MLAFASDLWPLFWAVIGSGAVLTVLATTLLAFTGRKNVEHTQPAVVLAHATRDREFRAAA